MKKRVMIQFTRADLRAKYSDFIGCPIFLAMQRAGVPVHSVRAMYWQDLYYLHYFSKKLQRASDSISEGRTKHLVGKKFQVTWEVEG